MDWKEASVEIVDIEPRLESEYFVCLESWSEEMREAGDHKERWFRKMAEKGLRVKIALCQGRAVGMIQYLPIEYAFARGSNLEFILCIWVHGYKGQGVGNQQKRGIGTALLGAAENDARTRGAQGMAAWGLSLPFFMRASWFCKHGYRKADRDSHLVLLWKPFTPDATAPKWNRQQKRPSPTSGRVVVTALINGWCPAMNLACERARRAAADIGNRVDFRMIDTSDRTTYLEWGTSDALFVDDKALRIGPPPSYASIRRRIARRVRRIPE